MKPLIDLILKKDWTYRLLITIPLGFPRTSPWFRIRERCHRLRLKKRGIKGYLQDTLITTPENVSIGDRVTFGGRVFISGLGGVTIGNDCMIAYGTIITSATHDPSVGVMNHITDAKPITIGNNVWIGAGAIILPGVELADGIVVGAGSVVTKSFVEPNVILAGTPAKIIRDRHIKFRENVVNHV
jgi:acetyltransferase-like isoleucine patch superfamily enzyme